MQIENIQNSITKLLSCLYSYFPAFQFQKTILTYTGSEKIKEFNSEKVGFKAVHTENDADIL